MLKMNNPFKFGTIVEDQYFTDRKQELEAVNRALASENHLTIISPRRYGKSSLVRKAVEQSGRPSVTVNMQMIGNESEFAARILKEVFKLKRWEKIKHLLTHFSVIPTITTNPLSDNIEVSFRTGEDSPSLIDDALSLLEKISSPKDKLIVVFDEFQEAVEIKKGMDKRLRGIIQGQKGINYIFLGSQEAMMSEIFENEKSPFYHFGTLIRLTKIPEMDFNEYITDRLSETLREAAVDTAKEILSVTRCHPYYTQQLSSQVWEISAYETDNDNLVKKATERLIMNHGLDYDRLWASFNRTDRATLKTLSFGRNPLTDRSFPTSTAYSSIKRLERAGYIIRDAEYEVEDPFFRQWIIKENE